ncbi:amidohydrolase [Parahalioglobus pacificus]|uniref:Peptidase n=1 Tax=Parahalioglobus pacificus TaxID=930806 RepID=A0A918XE77_9GAMM|nr:amidohydrolase [Halioglobus pacificus]NQY03374.1 amidohydrolase [Halieaceae bacterium]GHD28561.1 peptidase [Halioglobus pacificus]
MLRLMTKPLALGALICAPLLASADDLADAIQKDYDDYLGELFEHFHSNPELSFMENKTAERLAAEFREAGFEVTEGVGGTGVVALLENGPGPLVMMRADMDGLPVEEKSGLSYASKAKQVDWNGDETYVMHACGHDVHITSLVGTARRMAAQRDDWSGTLMLIAQPAEERVAGAKDMREDDLWERFGQPDYALAFHVSSEIPTGKLGVTTGSPYSGADTVDIIVHGVGAHGASPHRGVDPVVLGSQIVLALQTVVSRELPPREAGVITVGAFHAGSKHNIISDRAHLQLTVRNDNFESRDLLLDGIRRVAQNMGRVAGLPDDKLPEVIVSDESVPPTINDGELTQRLMDTWGSRFGQDVFQRGKRQGMGAEDFPFFTNDPYIPSTYFAVGGTPQADFDREAAGGEPVPSHHSPLFKITPRPAVTLGTEATVVGLMDLMGK